VHARCARTCVRVRVRVLVCVCVYTRVSDEVTTGPGRRAPSKLTLREILHLYFSETAYYGRMSCRYATAACPLRMPSPRRMPVRRRGRVRPASPGCRSHVDPNVPRSRAATTPPFTTRKHQSLSSQSMNACASALNSTARLSDSTTYLNSCGFPPSR
jgi:hypothetical protein